MLFFCLVLVYAKFWDESKMYLCRSLQNWSHDMVNQNGFSLLSSRSCTPVSFLRQDRASNLAQLIQQTLLQVKTDHSTCTHIVCALFLILFALHVKFVKGGLWNFSLFHSQVCVNQTPSFALFFASLSLWFLSCSAMCCRKMLQVRREVRTEPSLHSLHDTQLCYFCTHHH
jgi:hypothetical protein